MKPQPLSAFYPTITYYDYWERKEKFLLYEDRYEEWALIAVEAGVIYYEIGDHKGTAAFGDLLVCPPHTKFCRVVVEPVSFHFVRVVWQSDTEQDADPAAVLPSGKLTLRSTERLTADYACLRSIPLVTRLRQGSRRNHYIRDLWYTFCSEEEPAEASSVKERNVKPDVLMKHAEKRIRQNAFESFELRHIAAELGISPAQLTKRFKAAYGITPTEHLTDLRLDKARTLLLDTYLTLDQIAQCCGYENGFYLSRIFTKHFRIPPADYRKKYRV